MEHPRGFSDVFSDRATHGINIYQPILIYQETIGARLSCAFYWTRSSGSPPDGIEQYLAAELRGDYEGATTVGYGQKSFGGGQAIQPSLAPLLPFEIHGLALAAQN